MKYSKIIGLTYALFCLKFIQQETQRTQPKTDIL